MRLGSLQSVSDLINFLHSSPTMQNRDYGSSHREPANALFNRSILQPCCVCCLAIVRPAVKGPKTAPSSNFSLHHKSQLHFRIQFLCLHASLVHIDCPFGSHTEPLRVVSAGVVQLTVKNIAKENVACNTMPSAHFTRARGYLEPPVCTVALTERRQNWPSVEARMHLPSSGDGFLDPLSFPSLFLTLSIQTEHV